MKNPVNCWNALRAENATTESVMIDVMAEKFSDWVISSEATGKPAERSTSNAYSLKPIGNGDEATRARGMLLPVFEIKGMFSVKEDGRISVQPMNDVSIFPVSNNVRELPFVGFVENVPEIFQDSVMYRVDELRSTTEAELVLPYPSVGIKNSADKMAVKMSRDVRVVKMKRFVRTNAKMNERRCDFLASNIENRQFSSRRKAPTIVCNSDRVSAFHRNFGFFQNINIVRIDGNGNTSHPGVNIAVSANEAENVRLRFGRDIGEKIFINGVSPSPFQGMFRDDAVFCSPVQNGVFSHSEYFGNFTIGELVGKRDPRVYILGEILHNWTISQKSDAVKNIMMCSLLAGNRKGRKIKNPTARSRTWTISQLRNAGRYAGEETNQQTEYKLPTEIRNGLGDWMANKRDIAIFDAIAVSPSKVYLVNDRATTATIAAGDLMTLQQFVRAKVYAISTAYPKLPPIKIAKVGEKTVYRYVGLMHDHVAYDLSMNDPVYQQTVRDAGVRGNDNPMFTGALIDYMGMLLHAHDNCPISTTWGALAVTPGAESYLLGRQAVIVGIGGYKIQGKNGYLKWVEKRFEQIGPFTQECVSNNAVNSGNIPYEYAMAA